ncbi:MAG: helix-turn-helix transcriptional regulator [Steroidobacteraceae bacterium]
MNPATFGPSVRAAREAAKLSQNAVAKAIGMNRMYYSLFEAGRYLLNEEEEIALHDFLTSKRIALEDEPGEDVADRPRPAHPAPRAEPPEDPDADSPVDYRISAGADALEAVGALAGSTGVDSKRTAAAVAAAASALQRLDYPELIALANDLDVSTEGLISETDFGVQPIEQKQVWEDRAAGLLVCAALYDDKWTRSSCDELRVVREAVKKQMGSDDWNVRDCGFFESDKSYLPDLRCHLAPYIAKAAESRQAPALA